MTAATTAARLATIRDKVEAGERLSFDDGMFLEERRRPVHARRAGQPRPRAQERQHRLLQRQHAPQPDQRLRLPLHLLRLPGRPEEPEGLRHDRRADPRARRRGRAPRRDRAAHRRRPAPPAAVRVVSERRPHHPRRLSAAAPEGVHGGRVGLVRPADRPADARHPRRVQGRRPGQPARRRGGDLPPRGPRPDLRAQGRRRRLAPHPPRGPRARPALQRDDALRPHREGRSTASTT